MLAQLIPESAGPPVTLNRPITVIGRSSKCCDLVIDQTSISKMHCILVKTDGLIYMRDLGSTNGTRVNGQRVIRGALLPGDQLSFAGVTFRVHLGPDRPQTSKTPDGVNVPEGVTEEVPVIADDSLPEIGLKPLGQKERDSTARGKRRDLDDSDILLPD